LPPVWRAGPRGPRGKKLGGNQRRPYSRPRMQVKGLGGTPNVKKWVFETKMGVCAGISALRGGGIQKEGENPIPSRHAAVTEEDV